MWRSSQPSGRSSKQSAHAASDARSMQTPDTSRPIAPTPHYFDRSLPLIGLWQGLTLWALAYGLESVGVLATMPVLQYVLVQMVVTAPLLWYASAQAGMSARRRVLGVLAITAVTALLPLGFDGLGNLFTRVELDSHDSALDLLRVMQHNTWPVVLLTIVSLHLLLGWRTGVHGSAGWDYERLFRLTWRNAVLGVVALVLTGAFFGVLFAGSGMLRLIGIHQVWALLAQPVFNLAIGGMALGAAFALGLARAKMLVVMRHFWLSLTAWLLPLALAFVLAWVVALPFTGLQTLFDTRHAAVLLLGITALCVNFANSVYQDGLATPVLGAQLGRLVRWAWPALVVVVAVAGWALWLRVAHRGWSADRVWAALVWTVAALYVAGYAASAWRRGAAWLPTIARTNITVASVVVASLLLFLSPALSPETLAVRSQLARLQDPRLAPEDFDFSLLQRHAQIGRPALQALAARSGTPRDEDIAQRAQQQLDHPGALAEATDNPVLSEAQMRAKVTLLPAGATLDADLMAQLRGTIPGAWGGMVGCRNENYRCVLWFTDLDKDGQNELVLLSQHQTVGDEASASVFTARQGHWELVGPLSAPENAPALTLDQWVAAIQSQQVRPVTPQWPDLEVSGQRWQTRPEPR